ncbi:MAG: GNAT family N-acetyltransferase [Anaerolineae bacterium]|nr:GNAT family N-acetyltransferase [Anaerolineae bacterium]
MTDIVRLQAYLRQNAGRWFEAVPLPPFTLFIHPSDPLTYFNYAIPDIPINGDLGHVCDRLHAEFTTRNRKPRFEFIHEFAPHLGDALGGCGFVEISRQQLMCCTPDTARPAPDMPRLHVDTLNNKASIEDVQTFLLTQHCGFDPTHHSPVTIQEAETFLRSLDEGRAILAWLDDRPVCVGTLSTPYDGIAELSAVATVQPFRRRGIATALTAHAVQIAFQQGAQIVCLTAEDARAGRVYERVGFTPEATMLAYGDAVI